MENREKLQKCIYAQCVVYKILVHYKVSSKKCSLNLIKELIKYNIKILIKKVAEVAIKSL